MLPAPTTSTGRCERLSWVGGHHLPGGGSLPLPLPLRRQDEVVKGELWSAVKGRRCLGREVGVWGGPGREARAQSGWEVLGGIVFLVVCRLLNANRGALPVVRALAALETANCNDADIFTEPGGGANPGSCRDIPRGCKCLWLLDSMTPFI